MTRLKWLRRLQHSKVPFAFAGHCHRTEGGGKSFPGAYIKRKPKGPIVCDESPAHESKDADEEDDEDDEEDDEEGERQADYAEDERDSEGKISFKNVERDFDGPIVVLTNSVGLPLNDDEPGLRLVMVREHKVTHKYYPLGNIPFKIDIDKPLP